jgi:hypothetical protein
MQLIGTMVYRELHRRNTPMIRRNKACKVKRCFATHLMGFWCDSSTTPNAPQTFGRNVQSVICHCARPEALEPERD